jgi:hypothetical protein
MRHFVGGLVAVTIASIFVVLAPCGGATSRAGEAAPANAANEQQGEQPSRSPAEGKPRSLFSGKDLSGWRLDVPALDKDPNGKAPFTVRDGKLVSLGKPGGHLITDDEFGNYRLVAEYRFVDKPGNCGVLVHASKPRVLYGMFPQSLEVQMQSGEAGDFWCIHEDIEVPNMKDRRSGDPANWGATDGKERRIRNLTDDSEKPLGEWNQMVVECVGDEIKVWVNDELVNHGMNCTADKGRIAVQAEGTEVEFRKLELTPIEELTE